MHLACTTAPSASAKLSAWWPPFVVNAASLCTLTAPLHTTQERVRALT